MSLSFLIVASLGSALLYYLTPSRWKWLLLLAASLFIYAWCGLSAVPFILCTALTTWACALAIEHVGLNGKNHLREHKAELDAEAKKALKAKTRRQQRIFMLIALLLNFGILAALKYVDPLLFLFSRHKLGLVLPLGISFYTFQSMGYLLDVYNGKYAAERNPLRFMLFVSFFPQLIQGPIGRYDHLSAQLSEPHPLDIVSIERGLMLMLWGFFKKKVIADRALPLIEEVFGQHTLYGGAVIAIAVLFYSLQQYCDFSGGIDLVTGIAELYGIHLAPNFRRPYFSVSLGDFWRRWHISLGSWMRDYVFYPFALSRPMSRLGKSLKRHGLTHLSRALPAALGNILVFLLVGIWHGAQMNYILWGLYNGLILALTALLDPLFKQADDRLPALTGSEGFHLFRILRTFIVVNVGWYFDRCMRAADILPMLYKTFFRPAWRQLTDGTLFSLGLEAADYRILTLSAVLLFIVSLMAERGTDVRAFVLRLPLPIRWTVLILFMYFTLATFVGEGAASSGFMYAVF